ncbi:uncharacterized protein LOC110944836 [Helianthus annuus]|uniref:uncharacterized protein LOC110944836 n=1 Tax=Helianthus annuus TaxID=4232 RepID=UPI000B902DAD|nr:uncharacterized protein LOC110944836 [Helianthus annuus]
MSNVGNGLDTQFWTDTWVANLPLNSRFSALFLLEKFKGCCVRERLEVSKTGQVIGPKWCWAHEPLSHQEMVEITELNNVISRVILSDSKDEWGWSSEHSNEFSVKEVKRLIQNNNMHTDLDKYEWNGWIPRKVNIFGWRMNLDRLSTRTTLARRNITMASVVCPLCGEKDETVQHIFGSCYISSVVWHLVSRWLPISPIYTFNISDLLRVHNHINRPAAMKKMVHAIILTVCWSLWKLRNDVVFSGKRVDISRLWVDIKTTSFLWIKHRAKMHALDN